MGRAGHERARTAFRFEDYLSRSEQLLAEAGSMPLQADPRSGEIDVAD